MQTLTPTWPQRPAFTEAQQRDVQRYQALSDAEKDRCRRLVMLTGAPLGLAVSAIEATRETQGA